MIKHYGFLFLLISTLINAAEFDIRKFDVDKGLSLSQISALHQDKNGLLYIGTYGGGLNVFDGSDFSVINSSDGLVNNVITDLEANSKGEIFVATFKGISILSRDGIRNLTQKDGLLDNLVWKIYSDSDGRIWIGTEKGINLLENNSITSIEFPKKDGNKAVYSFHEIDKNKILIGTAQGTFLYSNGKFDLSPFNGVLNSKIVYDFSGELGKDLWIASNKGLYHENGKGIRAYTKEKKLLGKDIYDLHKISDKKLLISSTTGLCLYANGKMSCIEGDKELGKMKIWQSIEDLEGNIWVATDEGLFKVREKVFEMVPDNEGKKIDAWGIECTKNGEIWLASHSNGILRYRNGRFEKANRQERIRDRIVRTIEEDSSGVLWIGTERGLFRKDRSGIHEVFNEELGKRDVIKLLSDSENNLWIGTFYGGLYRYSNGLLKHFGEKDGLENQSVYSISMDKEEQIWIGTEEGVYLFKDDSLYIPSPLKELQIYEIVNVIEDKWNNLWIGTYENGLFNYNKIEQELGHVDKTNGLNDNSVLIMSFDRSENLWVGTNKGLNRIFIGGKEWKDDIKVQAFYKEMGIPGFEPVESAICNDNEGNIWYATVKGIVKFNPDEVVNKVIRPAIRINKFTVFGDDSLYVNQLPTVTIGDSKITLPSWKNNIKIDYSGISMGEGENLRYSYRFSGEEWSPLTYNRSVDLINMNSGSYLFEVRAYNSMGEYSYSPAAIRFSIATPIYKEMWFYVALFILGLFLLQKRYARVKKRNAILQKAKDEAEKAKEEAIKANELKSNFLAQMSHEIRTPINTILSFTSLLKHELFDTVDDDLKESFDIIDSGSRRLIRTIDSILNMSQMQAGTYEPNLRDIDINETIIGVISELKSAANEKGLALTFEREKSNNFIIGDEYTLSQLFVNLIENAIKYTEKGYVKIEIVNSENGSVIVNVKDSGIGISEEYLEKLFEPFSQEDMGYTRQFEGNGLGLALVKEYCELNQGNIFVQSKKGKGSVFSVSLKKSID